MGYTRSKNRNFIKFILDFTERIILKKSEYPLLGKDLSPKILKQFRSKHNLEYHLFPIYGLH